MRRLLALIAVLTVPLLLVADEKVGKANTLTPKEIAEGWVLLFDGETTFGWEIDGEAKVEKGVLILGGDRESRAETTTLSCAPFRYRYEVSWQGKTAPSFWDRPLRPECKGKFESWEKLPAVEDKDWKPVQGPIRAIVPAGSKLLLRNVMFRPDRVTSLFNGKDLTGWKVHKGDPRREKSKWTVTREGWLNVTNGAGDLQTEKTFDDFVLQLECISNGKHLNSGLFFRCIPGEYQQGYEAQIRNQFTDKPTQKYTVEEYDPKTHKLLGKKTVLSPAVDFGTGAIYRRMPARKGIAKDGEWFTMTILARGRHLATWVNGIQVVDWTDNRPASDNARTGYRAKAGAISIQGHDPTTNLSFRNIRIAPLPR